MEEPGDEVLVVNYGYGEGREESYPDAACSPRPRDPPVTTTTFPFKEKMLGKS